MIYIASLFKTKYIYSISCIIINVVERITILILIHFIICFSWFKHSGWLV